MSAPTKHLISRELFKVFNDCTEYISEYEASYIDDENKNSEITICREWNSEVQATFKNLKDLHDHLTAKLNDAIAEIQRVKIAILQEGKKL